MSDSDEDSTASHDAPSATDPFVAGSSPSTLPVVGARSFAELEYSPAEAAYRAHYDLARDSPSEAVVHAVAAVVDAPVDELEPLYSTVDSEALDAVFDPSYGGTPTIAQVTFSYEGTTVTVWSSGVIEVEP